MNPDPTTTHSPAPAGTPPSRDRWNPEVSVALCTYDGARYVGAQLASVLAQTHPVDEVVVMDDGSTDGTVGVIERIAADAQVPFRIFRNPQRLGVTANFEQALAACRGDVLMPCDQDDVWYPDKVARLLAPLRDDPGVVLCHADADLVDADLRPLGHTLFDALEITSGERAMLDAGQAFAVLLRRNLVTGATLAVRRALFEQARPFPAACVHDEWLALVAALHGRLARIEAPLVAYRQHGGNQIGQRKLSLAGKLAAVIARGTQSRARLVPRAQAVHERLHGPLAEVGRTWWPWTESALAHVTARASLPAARLRRLPVIARELVAGRYVRHSRGWLTVARDLIEPIRRP